MVDKDIDDFLWSCAFEQPGKDRHWIIPDRDDLFVRQRERQDDSTRCTVHSADVVRSKIPMHPTDDKDTLRVRVVEQRGQGVCDVIGGEVWEAALLLCALLIQTVRPSHSPHNALDALHSPPSALSRFLQESLRVLELGSGVGLPSLLLAQLRTESEKEKDREREKADRMCSVTMTDFDDDLVRALSLAVCEQFETADTDMDGETETETETAVVRLHATRLDWEDFLSDSFSFSSSSLPQCLHARHVDVVLGSALCYAPYHSACLAALIEKYLLESESAVQEVLVLQIHDREGFRALLDALREREERLSFSVEEVPRGVYEHAQSFYRSLSGREIESVSERETQRNREREEPVTRSVFDYYFPLTAQSLREEKSEIENERFKYNLLQTERDAFRLLRVFRK